MDLYTIQMSQWRILPKDVTRCDVTILSKDQFFKKNFAPPTYDLIRKYKKGEIDNKTYREVYLEHLKKNFLKNKEEWLAFLSKGGSVALMCFCKVSPTDNFRDFTQEQVSCHRFLLADFLEEIGDAYNITVINKGEFKSD